jgi:UPF0755 protein
MASAAIPARVAGDRPFSGRPMAASDHAPASLPGRPVAAAKATTSSTSHASVVTAQRSTTAVAAGDGPAGGSGATVVAMAERMMPGAGAPPRADSNWGGGTAASKPAVDGGGASGLYPAHPGLLSAAAARPAVASAERAAATPEPEGLSPSLTERRRITPRSPRAALEPEHVPVPTRRSKRARHPLVRAGNAIITFFVLIAITAGVGLFVGKQRFDAPGPLTQDHIVNIPRGYGTREIAELLVREGVIDQPWTFISGVIVLKAREGLKSGEYQFPKRASLQDVVDILTEGKVVQHPFTVPEGLTSEQIVARLMENSVLSGNIKEIPREGTLLPETYKFVRGTPREQIIQRMQQSQARLIKDIWERRMPDLPISTPEELITLASIIEKETARPDERTRVAAVFVNRLRRKMRLQSDPTIIYGLVGGKGTLGHPISKIERDQGTAYNTYTIDGLPPGPIANPGRASLEAAANPARTRELYFVADGTGGHTFSDNFEQHQKAVARLRAIEQNGKPEAVPQPAAAAAEPAPPVTPSPAPRPNNRRR